MSFYAIVHLLLFIHISNMLLPHLLFISSTISITCCFPVLFGPVLGFNELLSFSFQVYTPVKMQLCVLNLSVSNWLSRRSVPNHLRMFAKPYTLASYVASRAQTNSPLTFLRITVTDWVTFNLAAIAYNWIKASLKYGLTSQIPAAFYCLELYLVNRLLPQMFSFSPFLFTFKSFSTCLMHLSFVNVIISCFDLRELNIFPSCLLLIVVVQRNSIWTVLSCSFFSWVIALDCIEFALVLPKVVYLS